MLDQVINTFLVISIILSIYCVPTIIAVVRDPKSKSGIIGVNILTGWTIAGWLASLIWALTSKNK